MNTSTILSIAEKHREDLISVANQIWSFAEERFCEVQSCGLHREFLESRGFHTEPLSSSLPTAFRSSCGSGHPVLAFLGEYDALPGLSQQADATFPAPVEGQSCGHGCGHNLLGTGALGAALTARDYMEEHHLGGTIVYLGCPAEENSAGKSIMLKEGFFEGIDICFSWHPHFKTGLLNNALANCRTTYEFTGVSSHAAQAPHLGRSALDACELMNVGVNYLREHMIDEARVHFAYLNSGGTASNIIPAKAKVIYAVRAPFTSQALELKERVDHVAQGAALMTDTTVDIQQQCVYEHFTPNAIIDRILLKYMEYYTPVSYTEEELSYAASFVPMGSLPDSKEPVLTQPDLSPQAKISFSTDVGNVSRIIPTGACLVTCYAAGSVLHHWAVTAQGKSSLAHKGMMTAVKILASAACEFLEDPSLTEEAKTLLPA